VSCKRIKEHSESGQLSSSKFSTERAQSSFISCNVVFHSSSLLDLTCRRGLRYVERTTSLASSDIDRFILAATVAVVPPSLQGTWNDPNSLTLNGTETDTTIIVDTANIVQQKGGATGEPDQPIPATAITAVDGQLTDAGSVSGSSNVTSRSTPSAMYRRDASDYDLVFGGTGVAATSRDASIEGTAYLTYTLVSNSTYNVNDCLAFCDSVKECGTYRFTCCLSWPMY